MNKIVITKNIDKIIHEPARLDIMVNLFKGRDKSALVLKAETGLTWGNLSVQLRKLEKAGYVQIKKVFENNKPLTRVKLTQGGLKSYKKYKKTIINFLR